MTDETRGILHESAWLHLSSAMRDIETALEAIEGQWQHDLTMVDGLGVGDMHSLQRTRDWLKRLITQNFADVEPKVKAS